jgi:sporulation protein YlmC with PRC-barrel domain
MLMTHVNAKEVLGKKVYGNDGRLLGEVIGIAGRHGRIRAVIVRNDETVTRLPAGEDAPRLRVLD